MEWVGRIGEKEFTRRSAGTCAAILALALGISAGGCGSKDVNKAVNQAKQQSNKALNQAKKAANQAGKNLPKDAQQQINQANKAINKGKSETKAAAQKAKKAAHHARERAGLP